MIAAHIIDIASYETDNSLITRELGWRPRITFAEGIRRALDYITAHAAHYLESPVPGARSHVKPRFADALMMNPAEFATLRQAESELWWFRGMQTIVFNLLDPFADRYGWCVFPAHLASEGLSIARDRGLSQLCQADVSHCPFRSASFDMIVSLDVLVHFPPGARVGTRVSTEPPLGIHR